MENQINFRRPRDVGELLNATVFFAREHFKPLARALIYIAGPFLFLSSIGGILLQRTYGIPTADPNNPFGSLEIFTSPSYYVALLASLIGMYMILFVSFAYTMNYVETGESGSVEDLWARVLSDLRIHITTVIGTTIAAILSIVVVLIPCLGVLVILPLWAFMGVIFSILWPARLTEGLSFMGGYDRARELVKDFFWPTLGFLALVVVVQVVIMIVFSIPSMIAGFSVGFTTLRGETASVSLWLTIVSSLMSMIGSLVYALAPIGATINYFNLVERKEAPDLALRVDQLGSDDLADEL